MSGHSKWATIKRQKGAADVKKGQAFTKLSSVITLAVKQGGGIGDPDKNFRLRLAIEAARGVNMPKDTIERAIERASGKQINEMDEVIYEGFGPGGFSVIVEAITDNKQRTTPEVKSIFDKNGGTMGNPGSVSYQFAQKGLVTVLKNNKSFDDIFLLAAESGAEDLEEIGEEVIIYTRPEDLAKVKDAITSLGLQVTTAELTRKPLTNKTISDKDTAEKALNFLERLEDQADIQKVYANYDIPDAVMVS